MREQARRPSGNHPDTSGKVPKPARISGDYKLEIMPSVQIYELFKEIIKPFDISTKYHVRSTKNWKISHFLEKSLMILADNNLQNLLISRSAIPSLPIFCFSFIRKPNYLIDFRLDYLSTEFRFYFNHIPNRYCSRDLCFAPISTLFLPYFQSISINSKQSCYRIAYSTINQRLHVPF
ncbi:hypothetical protein SAMN00777080_4292 [Aquiflexum balticum DSM 16537]|uniref:Uncharacterized protein n=1 Tax=Aquiflexum balticum DSM 16537 TaxID=758820 RepID=A0A1W2HA13_9BACT|nr:hypothetical protein SAMN00777080_4292 [Aquiflexum balticum DSM 16537]